MKREGQPGDAVGERVTVVVAPPHQAVRQDRRVVVIRGHVAAGRFDGIAGQASLLRGDVQREGPPSLEAARLSDGDKGDT